jgi:hypothetical protein
MLNFIHILFSIFFQMPFSKMTASRRRLLLEAYHNYNRDHHFQFLTHQSFEREISRFPNSLKDFEDSEKP